jgi:peptidoglycan hydrolase-like protein with peptidoglycan-binding domain
MRLGRIAKVIAAAITLAVTMFLTIVGLETPASAASSWPSISQGASGADATTVQLLLRQHGHNLAADGQFGPATASAVTSFQSTRGLVADGVVGPQTWPHLVVSVREGSTGEAVKAAQTQLNKFGAGLTVDGVFGSMTAAAARSFQSAHGLSADGIVGPLTWQTLVGGGGGGNPAGYALPLDRGALSRAAYGAAHWNATPAIDLMVHYVPAYAVTSGVVDHYDSTSCGIGIRLLQPDGARIVYCHLSARSVADGAAVSAGTRLGTTGDTGNSGDPHLHIEIRTSDSVARCPQRYLLAIYDGQQPPSLASLPTSGCTG